MIYVLTEKPANYDYHWGHEAVESMIFSADVSRNMTLITCMIQYNVHDTGPRSVYCTKVAVIETNIFVSKAVSKIQNLILDNHITGSSKNKPSLYQYIYIWWNIHESTHTAWAFYGTKYGKQAFAIKMQLLTPDYTEKAVWKLNIFFWTLSNSIQYRQFIPNAYHKCHREQTKYDNLPGATMKQMTVPSDILHFLDCRLCTYDQGKLLFLDQW